VIGAEIDSERMVRVGAVVHEKLTDLLMVSTAVYNMVHMAPNRPKRTAAREQQRGSTSENAPTRSPSRSAFK
jgi:hypothetical protein